MSRTNADLFVVNLGTNTVSNNILNLCVELVIVLEATYLCLVHNCSSHAVWEVLLNTCSKTQKLVLGATTEADNALNMWNCLCQRTGLIKDDKISSSDLLEVFSALNRHAKLSCLIHCATHCNRSGKLNGAGIVNHKNGHSLSDVSGNAPNTKEGKEAVRNQCIRKALCLRLCASLKLSRLLNHINNIVDTRHSWRSSDAYHEVTVFKSGACVNG